MPPVTIRRFETTPNPNAVKCILAGAIPGPARSYRTRPGPGEPIDHPVAAALFRIPQVAGLLLSGDWMTVPKAPEARWAEVKPAVVRALAGLP